MKLMITGGGTGGHVFPGIAVAREVLKDRGSMVIYVGKKTGPEEGWLKEQGIPFEGIDASGLPRRLSPRLFTFGFDLISGLVKAYKLVGSHKPQAVFSTGGYVSFPLSLAALLRGVPVFLLEPNVEPGLVAKVMAPFAQGIFAGFEETMPRFNKKKTIFTGIPIREEILAADKNSSLEKFGLKAGIPTVLFVGGSQGARNLNVVMLDALNFIGEGVHAMQAIVMTGKNDYMSMVDALEKCPLKIVLRPFITNIHEAYAASDLVVARSGAMTCAELTSRGIPSVLVPYPHAGAHQEKNARALEKGGASVVMIENELDGGKLAETILSILGDPGRLQKMSESALHMGRPEAAGAIVTYIRAYLERKKTA